jgi:hypothetical protein
MDLGSFYDLLRTDDVTSIEDETASEIYAEQTTETPLLECFWSKIP